MIKFFLFYLYFVSIGFCFGRECKNLPPGFSRLQMGVDITKLDWLPLDTNGRSGFKRTVIKLTCDEVNKDCDCAPSSFQRIPNLAAFDKPDEVRTADVYSTGSLGFQAQMYKTSHDYQKRMAISAGIDVAGGIFSASTSYEKIERNILEKESYVEEVERLYSLYTIEMKLPEEITIDEGVQNRIKNLPNNLDATSIKNYTKFLDTFGTHLIYKGYFGGSLRSFISTRKSYVEKNSEDKVTAEAKGLIKSVAISSKFEQSSVSVSKEFRDSSRKEIRYFGGTLNMGGNETEYDQWKDTIKDSPIIYKGELVPIHRLIKNKEKREAMENATEIYIAKAYAKDLKKKVQFAKRSDIKFWNWDSEFFNVYTQVGNAIESWKRVLMNDVEVLLTKPLLRSADVNKAVAAMKQKVKQCCYDQWIGIARKVYGVKSESEGKVKFDVPLNHCYQTLFSAGSM